jgi:hypothetical protein
VTGLIEKLRQVQLGKAARGDAPDAVEEGVVG